MAVPKRKTSKARRDKRKSANMEDEGTGTFHLPAVSRAKASTQSLP